VAATGGRTRGLHAFRISAKQRIHLAALLIALACAPLLRAADDIVFDPSTTQQEFETFSRLFAQGIYMTPVEPARARGLLGFDVGVAVTAVPVDTDAPYWQHAVTDDFSVGNYVAVPRVVVAKGFSVATISASYAKVQGTNVQIWGGALDVPVINGGLLKPTLALRGSYATLRGTELYDLKTYGVELFLSKGFGPITPYAAIGRARSDAEGIIGAGIPDVIPRTYTDQADSNRITVGVKLSLLLPKIVVEATQGEQRSYAAKISFGL
jgi:hypothetical protein